MEEHGWLKSVLEHATADRDTWPAWQRGQEAGERGDGRETGQAETAAQEPRHEGKAAA